MGESSGQVNTAKLGGTCIRFGHNVDTDIIIPARYLITIDPQELAKYAFEPLGANVQARLRSAQVVVAGNNFGCGSAREQAATALLGAGIQVVVAASFARAFFRNAINGGLMAVTCPAAVDAVTDGARVLVDFVQSTVDVEGRVFPFVPYPAELTRLVEAGGLLPYIAMYERERGFR